MTINIDGSGERKIASCRLPDLYRELAWSPRGDVIALTAVNLSGARHGRVATIPVSGGEAKTLSSRTWVGVDPVSLDRGRWRLDSIGCRTILWPTATLLRCLPEWRRTSR
jgi:hypothetical protein